MTEFTTSADGTRIAYDRDGDGPAVILVGGAMQFRGFDPTTVEMAHQLAAHGFTVINHDRRGRGESAGATEFSLAREIEDLAALIDGAGGTAALYGSSSGGAIALAGCGGRIACHEACPVGSAARRRAGHGWRGIPRRIARTDRRGRRRTRGRVFHGRHATRVAGRVEEEPRLARDGQHGSEPGTRRGGTGLDSIRASCGVVGRDKATNACAPRRGDDPRDAASSGLDRRHVAERAPRDHRRIRPRLGPWRHGSRARCVPEGLSEQRLPNRP